MDKVIPHLGDFREMPSSFASEGNLYLILFRTAQGEWRLDQWPLGSPHGVQPLYYHPTPVSRLDLSRRFWAEVKYKLPFWKGAFPEGVA